MILRYILWTLLAYFLYKFVFEFIVPLARTTKQIKKQVTDFQNRMQQEQPEKENAHSKPTKPTARSGDYIDFEEVN